MESDFPLRIVRSKRRSLCFRYEAREDVFLAYAPLNYPIREIEEAAYRHRRALLNMRKRLRKQNEDTSFYLFGVRRDDVPEGKREALLRKSLREYIDSRIKEAARECGIDFPVTVKIRKMKSRYGVNAVSKKTITFALLLGEYSPKIIDSVIYHELTHFHYLGHGKAFYNYLLRRFPDYRACRKALINRIRDYGL